MRRPGDEYVDLLLRRMERRTDQNTTILCDLDRQRSAAGADDFEIFHDNTIPWVLSKNKKKQQKDTTFRLWNSLMVDNPERSRYNIHSVKTANAILYYIIDVKD